MQANENSRGARNRIMILMYITWLTLSLAPAMVAPPERGFAQGQPEMQQAMDNMVTHKTIIKKRMNAPSSDGTDYHAVLSAKTSNLLAKAEQVLSSLPNSKERQWIEAFVQRMKAMATMLEKPTQNKNLPKNLNTMNGTPVPEGLPLQPTWPVTSAVPGINPFQKMNRMMSKFPVTSSELSKVLPANEYPSERQAVTKPAVLSNNKDTQEDELVRELESLHNEHSEQEHSKNSKVLDQAAVLTTPSNPMSLESSTVETADVEAEKVKLQAKLIQELAEFQRLGGVIPSEVINALHTENHKLTDLTSNQNSNTEDKMKFTEAGMVDRQGFQKLDDLNNEEKEISNSKFQASEKDIPYRDDKLLLEMKSNQSFQNVPPNFHPNLQAYPKQIGNHFHYISPQNKVPYQGGLQHGAQNFQRFNPYNHGKYHPFVAPPNQQQGYMPEGLKQMVSKQQNNIHNGHLPSDYNEYLMRHSYGPYPYLHNWDPKNTTLHLPPMMTPYINKPPMTHQIDTQLSDEMKRQLRDGKIIVLSDSVVRSNFETNNGEETTENAPNTLKSENKNNITVTEN